MRQVEFEQANTTAYSPLPNTPAVEWEQQLPEVKQERLQEINRLASQHALKPEVTSSSSLLYMYIDCSSLIEILT